MGTQIHFNDLYLTDRLTVCLLAACLPMLWMALLRTTGRGSSKWGKIAAFKWL